MNKPRDILEGMTPERWPSLLAMREGAYGSSDLIRVDEPFTKITTLD